MGHFVVLICEPLDQPRPVQKTHLLTASPQIHCEEPQYHRVSNNAPNPNRQLKEDGYWHEWDAKQKPDASAGDQRQGERLSPDRLRRPICFTL